MLERLKDAFRPFGFSFRLSLVDAIKRDHDDLKEMLEILKDDEVTYSEKRKLYPDFASLLKSHSLSEEEAVYDYCKNVEDLRTLTLTGEEEHHVAQELMMKIQATRTRDLWMAKVKVLAEIVEHHLIEEEHQFLPDLSESLSVEEEQKILEDFLRLRQNSQKTLHQDNAGVLDQLL